MGIEHSSININRDIQRQFAYVLEKSIGEMDVKLTAEQEDNLLFKVAKNLEPFTVSTRGYLKYLNFPVDKLEK